MTPVYPLLTDIFEHTLLNIHHLHESLKFWKAQPSNDAEISQIINVLEGIQKYLAIFLSKVRFCLGLFLIKINPPVCVCVCLVIVSFVAH